MTYVDKNERRMAIESKAVQLLTEGLREGWILPCTEFGNHVSDLLLELGVTVPVTPFDKLLEKYSQKVDS